MGYTLAKSKVPKERHIHNPGQVVYVSECRAFEAKLQHLGSCGEPQCPSAAATADFARYRQKILFYVPNNEAKKAIEEARAERAD